jgi:predicted RNA-binding Zn-ribbon protein involved in translation (DUF1610 family)
LSEVDRFFRQLVDALSAAGPGRLREPVTVTEITASLLPYRTHRRALGLDSSEDYELTLLRLCAGEGGLAHTEPPDVLALFQAELASPHPDLSVLARGAHAALILAPRRVAEALSAAPADPHQPYAPPAATPTGNPSPAPAPAADAAPAPIRSVEIVDTDDALPLDDIRLAGAPAAGPAAMSDEDEASEDTGAEHCSFCGGALPAGRLVNFCPHCGQSQSVTHCPECKAEVELGWRHCISCGFALG